jgi:hypothetical protein
MNQNSFNSQEVESIYHKFQQIDKKLQDLEKANQRIIVTGGKSQPQPKPINISEEELINIYNYTPQILGEYATPVSITADTYREKTVGNIYLESTINGYYWVILREENNEKFYYLVPNGDRNLKLYRLQNQLNSLFIIQGQVESNQNNLSIEKFANLQILPSGYSWQLLDKGIIKIAKPSSINKLLNELQKINTQSGEVPTNITNLLSLVHEDHQNLDILKHKQKNLEKYVFETINKFLELKNKLEESINKLKINLNEEKQEVRQLKQKEENYSQQINLMNKRIKDLKHSLNNLSVIIASLQQNRSQNQENINTVTYNNHIVKIEPSLPSENESLAQKFKKNPQSFIKNATRVGMTKETVNKVVVGTWKGIIELESSRQGEFFIVASNNATFYLLLDPNTTFNPPTLSIINESQVFICLGNISKSFKGSEINIIKPAIVAKGKQNWFLIESGEIQFN